MIAIRVMLLYMTNQEAPCCFIHLITWKSLNLFCSFKQTDLLKAHWVIFEFRPLKVNAVVTKSKHAYCTLKIIIVLMWKLTINGKYYQLLLVDHRWTKIFIVFNQKPLSLLNQTNKQKKKIIAGIKKIAHAGMRCERVVSWGVVSAEPNLLLCYDFVSTMGCSLVCPHSQSLCHNLCFCAWATMWMTRPWLLLPLSP